MTGNKVPGLHIPILKADHDISNVRHRYGTDTHYARFQSSINYALRSIFSEVLRVLQDQIILRMMDFTVSCIPGIGHFPDNFMIMYQYGPNRLITTLSCYLCFLDGCFHVPFMVIVADIP